MNQPPVIDCKPDGPYLVSNLEDLRDAAGAAITAKPVMALCRCGGSANKPFCDGTHAKNGFSGARLADGSTDKRDSYAGKGIVIHDNRSICAHAGRCTDGLGTVFKYKSEPWIDPAGGGVEAIVDTVRSCPSGALSYTLDGVEGPDDASEPSITVSKDGPYEVAGAVQLPGVQWAKGAASGRFTLCRCGASRNKPFCDGTHWSVGFKG
ncbi:MAG: CDGSH iron-sulfur domain-containing protein [Betaproteobacteria bacterium]